MRRRYGPELPPFASDSALYLHRVGRNFTDIKSLQQDDGSRSTALLPSSVYLTFFRRLCLPVVYVKSVKMGTRVHYSILNLRCVIISRDESLEFPRTLSSMNISMANFSQEMESKIMFQSKNVGSVSQISIHDKIIYEKGHGSKIVGTDFRPIGSCAPVANLLKNRCSQQYLPNKYPVPGVKKWKVQYRTYRILPLSRRAPGNGRHQPQVWIHRFQIRQSRRQSNYYLQSVELLGNYIFRLHQRSGSESRSVASKLFKRLGSGPGIVFPVNPGLTF